MSLKIVRYAAWGAVVAVAFLVGISSVLWFQNRDQGAAIATASIGGDFLLTSTDGDRVTEADYLGKPRAMFFGFTHCPDVCPTTLYEASNWIETLGADADKMSFLFVSVDPERDTPDIMKDYVSAFDGNIQGLTGSREEVDAVIKAYRVFARKVELEGDDYTVDHTASVYLLDADGKFFGSISPNDDPENAVRKLRSLIVDG
ncbi:MAG: SCO family protein [Pseudomonadota bacterium]